MAEFNTDISVIIVNYNTTIHIRNCLESIIKFTEDVKYEIIIVDNNSPERDIEALSTEYKCVKFFMRSINDGFGSGCNFGAKQAKGKYLLFINPDNIILDNAFKRFFMYMESNPDVALCTGLLTDEDGNLKYSYNKFPDVVWEFKEAFRIGYVKAIHNLLEKTEIKENREFEIDWALGALLFVRKNIFESVNGFDNTFFLYYEDDDLQLRIRKSGYKIMCLPFIRMMHSGSSSIQDSEGYKIYDYHFNKSRMHYLHKHFNFFSRNLIRLFFIISNSLRILYLPFNFKQRNKRLIYLKRTLRVITIYCKP